MKQLFTILRTAIYVPLFIGAFGWLAQKVRVFDQKMSVSLPGWTRPPGIFLMIAGGLLALACIVVFVCRGKGTPAIFDAPTQFVAIGPYAYVRNPMYIGGFNLLVGFGAFLGSLSILLLAVVLLFLFHLLVILVEEPGLERQFGKSYTDYKLQINRWVPKWRKMTPKAPEKSNV